MIIFTYQVLRTTRIVMPFVDQGQSNIAQNVIIFYHYIALYSRFYLVFNYFVVIWLQKRQIIFWFDLITFNPRHHSLYSSQQGYRYPCQELYVYSHYISQQDILCVFFITFPARIQPPSSSYLPPNPYLILHHLTTLSSHLIGVR